MRQFGTILKFELKKILQRRGTWLAFGILAAFTVMSQLISSLGVTYVNGEVYESHWEGAKKDRANGLKFSGRKLDEEMIEEIRQAYALREGKEWPEFMRTEEYEKNVRPYQDVADVMYTIGYYYRGKLAEGFLTEEQLYSMRQSALEERWNAYRLSEREKAYWQKKEDEVEKPFIYQYAVSFDILDSMGGIYSLCLLVGFFVAVCMCGVFAEEHTRRTDQLVLCSRLGRREVYFAKLAAGTIVSLAAGVILLALMAGGCFIVYGTEGFDAMLQLQMPLYSYPLTVGEVALIMTGIYVLAVIVMAVLTMVISELFHNSIAALAVIVALMFVSRLVAIPEKYRLAGMLWNCFALNILKLDAGFSDQRLFSVFGQQLTLWQMTPILYVLVGVVAVCFGKRIYAMFQVEGR